MKNFVTATLVAMGIVLGLGSPADAQGAVVAEQIEAKAIVESVDQTTRAVLLRSEDGRLATIKVSPEVRNLAQVKAGDRVVLRVRLGVVAEMAPPDGAGGPAAEADIAGRAPAGARPAGFTGEAIRVRVTFNSYEPKIKTVSYTLPSGKERNTVLRTMPMQDFASGLKAGDKVDVTFVESVVAAFIPMK